MSDRSDDDEPKPDNVIIVDFGYVAPVTKPGDDDETEITRSGAGCLHRAQMQLDTASRTVRCTRCDTQLDAFQILLQYAQRERSWRYYDREAKQLYAEIDKLREEEKRIKARTRNAARKDAEAAVQAERERWRETRRKLAWYARDLEKVARVMKRAADLKVDDPTE